MAHDFWDVLTFSTVMAVRDWSRDNQRRKEKTTNFYQKCNEEIADAASEMFEVITAVAEQANPNYIPNEIGQGGVMLPVYAFYKVLQKQGGLPTKEQTKVMDLFFNAMSLPFSKLEFLAAVRSYNTARQSIENLVGISDLNSGKFWQLFFKSMYITQSDEKTLTKLTDKFSSIIMRFSILGRPESEVALPICEEFINSVHKQIQQCRNLPEEDIDFMGEVSFYEHYQRMRNLSIDLVHAAGDEDELDIEQLFDYFSIGILFQLVTRTTRNISVQAEMLDKAMEISGISLGIDGYEAMKQLTESGELSDLVNNIIHIREEFGGFWGIILIVAQKADREDDAMTFTKECMGYLMGIETELSKEYPYSGFGTIAKDYMVDVMGKIARLCA